MNQQITYLQVRGEINVERKRKRLYSLDGYCPMLNLAIEIDEPHHKDYLEKDLRRQNIIKQVLNCQFLRINVGVI